MSQRTSSSGDSLDSAGSALAARNHDLAEADHKFGDLIEDAYATALAAIARLDQLEAEIEATVAEQAVDSPAEARGFARFLLDKQHEIIDVVTRARSEVDAKTVTLQQLIDQYRSS